MDSLTWCFTLRSMHYATEASRELEKTIKGLNSTDMTIAIRYMK